MVILLTPQCTSSLSKTFWRIFGSAGILRPFDRLRASLAQYKSCPRERDAHTTVHHFYLDKLL